MTVDSIEVRPTKWGPVALVCRKCGKKLHGGFGRKGKQDLADELHLHLRSTDRRRALRVVETGCLGICPKNAVAIALDTRILVVPAGTATEAISEALLPAPLPS